MPDLCTLLLDRLSPTVPSDMTVRVLCDRGLQSSDLWAALHRQGWHPKMRYDRYLIFQAATGSRWSVWHFVTRAGQYTVMAGCPIRCTAALLVAQGMAPTRQPVRTAHTELIPIDSGFALCQCAANIRNRFRKAPIHPHPATLRLLWMWLQARLLTPKHVESEEQPGSRRHVQGSIS